MVEQSSNIYQPLNLNRIIIEGLEDLLKQREENFRDHTQRCKKKTIVALTRIFHPFTILSLAYTAGLIYNIHRLEEKDFDNHLNVDFVSGKSLITQHYITIIVLLLLIILDIYLKIQRLNYKVFNIDSKLQNLIEQFNPYGLHTNREEGLISQNQEKEFAYYQNCFTWTIRNGEWRKIPNNTLAKGDVIKLLPGDKAPALVKYFNNEKNTDKIDEGLLGIGISKTPQISSQDPKLFGKGQKIVLPGLNEVLQKVSQLSGLQDTNDPAEAFERSKKEYKLFEVQTTPCVTDLTEFINNMETKKNFSKNLLYFSNAKLAEKILNFFLGFSWLICISINISFILTDRSLDYFDQNVYLTLIGYSFMVPFIFSICEAWANALIITLFNTLQYEDYYKLLPGSHNLYKLLKKETSNKNNLDTTLNLINSSIANLENKQNDDNVSKKLNIKEKKKKKKKKKFSWRKFLCYCSKSHQISRLKKQRSKQKKLQKNNQKLNNIINADDFYKSYDFQNRGIRKNWKVFWGYVRSGSNHLNNYFAALSCVSILAFVDKEGIVSETSKYVDEIGVIDKNQQKVVFDLIHDSHVKNEEEIYQFENSNVLKENQNILKALGLSFMFARNPKESDTEKQLKEIFSKDPQMAKEINKEIGFYFHNALRAETESHQDCVCALAKLIGHTDSSFPNFETISSIWNVLPSVPDEKKKSDGEKRKVRELEFKKHKSFDDFDKDEEYENLVEKNSVSEDDIDKKSFKSELSQRGKAIFADQKNLKKMLLERFHKFGHLVTTIVKDKSDGKLQSFSRGEANIIFNNCSDYWNGEKIVPIKKEVESFIKDILFQWQASDFVTIGFSYKPIIPDIQDILVSRSTEKRSKSRDVLESFQNNQIFLGIIGIKHHQKQEANELFQSLDDAGIRGVLFSKEEVLETKSLAKELGIDSEWNAWISLAENPSDFTKLYNQDGHLILPYGIEGIKKHIEEVDTIPLQVPMFCDTTAETTTQMFQIYQEHDDVVCCIGNIMNSENLHIFQQANVAIGMMIEPQYRCNNCNGLISHNQQKTRYVQFDNSKSSEYQPNKLEKLSAAINALACTFVFDANTSIYFFFSVFREARRLRESVEQASLLSIFIYLMLFLIFLLDLCLGLYNYIDQLETLYILFVFVPLFSFSCMSRPTKNSIMKRHVLSPKYLPYLDFAIFMIKSSFLKMIVGAALMYSVRIFYIRQAIEHFRETQPQDYFKAFQVDEKSQMMILDQFNYILYGKYISLKRNYKYWQLTFEFEHKFNFSYLLIILTYLSIGYESPNYTLLFKFTKNKYFRLNLVIQVLITVAYYLLSTMSFLGPNYPHDYTDLGNYYYPQYDVWLCAIASLLIIALIEELTKKKVRKLFDRDHNRLMIFFSTKLGMWSPR
ncbi:transmembrane protein [Stylonychia lemnae]|uniref:Transmembrane protein n=1 Tax=Stylonychia lemnae TaxID=5949 RepID=A0A078B2S9_STYLE|nr:transmembrane protein [Stylonychia lemnae]|eukprot:CDW88835.1 transmembrane protein [Stylonychia lemnae]